MFVPWWYSVTNINLVCVWLHRPLTLPEKVLRLFGRMGSVEHHLYPLGRNTFLLVLSRSRECNPTMWMYCSYYFDEISHEIVLTFQVMLPHASTSPDAVLTPPPTFQSIRTSPDAVLTLPETSPTTWTSQDAVDTFFTGQFTSSFLQ